MWYYKNISAFFLLCPSILFSLYKNQSKKSDPLLFGKFLASKIDSKACIISHLCCYRNQGLHTFSSLVGGAEPYHRRANTSIQND